MRSGDRADRGPSGVAGKRHRSGAARTASEPAQGSTRHDGARRVHQVGPGSCGTGMRPQAAPVRSRPHAAAVSRWSRSMDQVRQGSDALFILLGATMVLAMHAGFAFLELGTVRKKNQVNALVRFLVLLTFAAAIPAIVSGGIAERARFGPQLIATAVLVGLIYPLFEGVAWNRAFGIQAWLGAATGAEFHDFAGSVVVHAVGGWIGLVAVLLLGARAGRYRKDGMMGAHPPSSIPFLALGSWALAVGWFGFNVMSAQTIDKISGLVAVNSLMAMVGGILAALAAGRNDPGFVHNGPLAGLVAVCAGSDLMHPIGALITGGIAGALFVYLFTLTQNRWRIDDVLGV